jgi:hypothetical protein
MAGPSKVLCIFCDRTLDRAQEDIISTWLAKLLGGVPPFFSNDDVTIARGHTIAAGRPKRTGTAAALKLPDVCQDCNNTWMSRIESAAKPILVPMIEGNACDLTACDRIVLATWAQLKLITYDARKAPRALPPTMAHAFGQLAQPYGTPLVLLGRFGGYPEGIGIPHGRWVGDATVPGQAPCTVVRVTLAFGSLFLQVVDTVQQRSWPIELLAPPNSEVLARCWPQDAATVSWPPRVLIESHSWRLLA